MATAFSELYARFSGKITDYVLMELSDRDAVEIMHGYLVSAIAKMRELRSGAFEYVEENVYVDDDGVEVLLGPHFVNDLIEIEKELLSLGMVQEWLDPQIKSVLNTRQFVSSKETSFFAQHNHFNGLLHMQKETRIEKHHLLTQYKILHNDYLGTTESV